MPAHQDPTLETKRPPRGSEETNTALLDVIPTPVSRVLQFGHAVPSRILSILLCYKVGLLRPIPYTAVNQKETCIGTTPMRLSSGHHGCHSFCDNLEDGQAENQQILAAVPLPASMGCHLGLGWAGTTRRLLSKPDVQAMRNPTRALLELHACSVLTWRHEALALQRQWRNTR